MSSLPRFPLKLGYLTEALLFSWQIMAGLWWSNLALTAQFPLGQGFCLWVSHTARCAEPSEEALPPHKHFHNSPADNSQLHTPSFYSQASKEKYPLSAPNKLLRFDKLFSFPLKGLWREKALCFRLLRKKAKAGFLLRSVLGPDSSQFSGCTHTLNEKSYSGKSC